MPRFFLNAFRRSPKRSQMSFAIYRGWAYADFRVPTIEVRRRSRLRRAQYIALAVLLLFGSGCKKVDYGPLRQYEAALRELSIATNIGITESEFRKRLTDCTVKVDALRGRLTDLGSQVPAKNKGAFVQAILHLDRSMRAYRASLGFWKPPGGYPFYGDDVYQDLVASLPGFAVSPSIHEEAHANPYAGTWVPAADHYDMGVIFDALWEYGAKELVTAEQSLDALGIPK
jgi:hypothetical protein